MPGEAAFDRLAPIRAAHPGDSPRAAQRYWAFLSYSHADSETADWLHEALEQFRVPAALVDRLTEQGPVPRRLSPIFRDRHELAAAADLTDEITDALAGARFLVVLCSPAAAASRWTNREIDCFKRQHGESRILAVIIAGEPFASAIPGREGEECFPHALRVRYDRRGRPTDRRADPVAADFRPGGDGRQRGLLKLIAGMLGLRLDELVQRDSHRRQRRQAMLTGASLLGMAVSAGLALTAIQARDAARDQRRQAEGLIGFMLGDLRDKLQPLGRLDVLDAVGARALEYYGAQDRASLSDAALAQRSRALTLMGEIAFTRGDLDGALNRYRQAMASTAESVRRTPNEPAALFDHAQNIFWVGYIDWQRGDTDRAATAYRDYQRLARRMIALAPNDPKYRLEAIYADTNLGAVLLEQRHFQAAADAFQGSLQSIEALAAAAPGNLDYQKQLSESLAYLADAREGAGQLDDATALRRRQLALLSALWRASDGDMQVRRQELAARRSLSRLLASRGEIGGALQEAAATTGVSAMLTKTEPNNTEWLDNGVSAGFDRAELELAAGQVGRAQETASRACATAESLLRRDPSVVDWKTRYPRRCLTVRARIALASGQAAAALGLAQQALTMAREEKDPVERGFDLATTQLVLGAALRASGQGDASKGALQSALSAWPQGVEERPREMAIHAVLLSRAGQDAAPLKARLAAIGYRHPAYLTALKGGS